jgi:large subunit ribosomal protein L4
VIFGPQERVRITKIDKKIKKGVLNEMLINLLNQQKVFSLNWAPLNEIPKTKLAYQALQAAGFSQKRVVLLLNAQDVLSYASFANIANVRILFFDQPNAYDLSLGDCWMFLEKDRELFKTMVSQWA